MARHQGIMTKAPPCAERTFEKAVAAAKLVSAEDRRIAFEETAKRMLTFLEDSEDLKVGVTENISSKQIAQQTIDENGQNIFDIFRQREDDVRIASRS